MNQYYYPGPPQANGPIIIREDAAEKLSKASPDSLAAAFKLIDKLEKKRKKKEKEEGDEKKKKDDKKVGVSFGTTVAIFAFLTPVVGSLLMLFVTTMLRISYQQLQAIVH